jgi:hypothetical protein
LIRWSKAYCEHAVSTHGVAVELAPLEWEVSTRAKRRAAAVKRPKLSRATIGETLEWDEQSGDVTDDAGRPVCTVSLSWRAFEAFDYEEWTATLRHELVHVEQFQAFGTTDHGPEFRRRAGELDAPINVRHFATPAYVVSCTSCETVVARRYRACKLVREVDSYVSSCCQASLRCRTPE